MQILFVHFFYSKTAQSQFNPINILLYYYRVCNTYWLVIVGKLSYDFMLINEESSINKSVVQGGSGVPTNYAFRSSLSTAKREMKSPFHENSVLKRDKEKRF